MTFDEVFTYANLSAASDKCKNLVRWKSSTQKHEFNEILILSKLYTDLHTHLYKPAKPKRFITYDRGKAREIQSCNIRDRVVQKCFCDCYLIPLMQKKLIYDNGACIRNKGITFSCKRLKCHLQRYFRKHGTDGYILKVDIKSFFASIDHAVLLEMACKIIDDDNLFALYTQLIKQSGAIGLGLGSQVSQISATYYLNILDHYIKDNLQVKYYGRYMDDLYIISDSKEFLYSCLDGIKEILAKLKLICNVNKTQVVKLSRGFKFLNKYWILKDTGAVICRASRVSIHRHRWKLKKLAKKWKNECLPIDAAERCQQSWKAGMQRINSWYQILKMDLLYAVLFKKE